MNEEIFRDLGFSEREIKVYLALLELGQTTAGPIAAKTRLQHSKVYPTLEKLIDRGLVNYVIISKTKHFQAQDPKQILNILKEKEHIFSEILPELQLKQQLSKERQTATVYEGYKAIRAMFDSIIENSDENGHYYVFAFKDEYALSKSASIFLRNIHVRLSEKGVEDKLIAHVSIKKDVKKNYMEIKKMEFRFTNIELPVGLIITNDRVINWVWGERPTAIVIVSKQIAHQYNLFFLEIWNISKA